MTAPNCPFCASPATLDVSEHGIDRYRCTTCGKFWAWRSNGAESDAAAKPGGFSAAIISLLRGKGNGNQAE